MGWLYRTTTNRCLNIIRARRPVAEADLDSRESAAGAGSPERAAQVSEQLIALAAALKRLTPEQRACWLLREVPGVPIRRSPGPRARPLVGPAVTPASMVWACTAVPATPGTG